MINRPEFKMLQESGYDWNDPFDIIRMFEDKISRYTGAPYVTVTDCCTHALEICLRYLKPTQTCTIPKYNYISVPMTFMKLDIPFVFNDEEWQGYYQIGGTNILDMACRFTKDCYVPGTHSCLSFGNKKVLKIMRGGAILTDNEQAHQYFQKMRYDGRDLTYAKWPMQPEFDLGFHYNLSPEDCARGILLMDELAKDGLHNKDAFEIENIKQYYADLEEIKINDNR